MECHPDRVRVVAAVVQTGHQRHDRVLRADEPEANLGRCRGAAVVAHFLPPLVSFAGSPLRSQPERVCYLFATVPRPSSLRGPRHRCRMVAGTEENHDDQLAGRFRGLSAGDLRGWAAWGSCPGSRWHSRSWRTGRSKHVALGAVLRGRRRGQRTHPAGQRQRVPAVGPDCPADVRRGRQASSCPSNCSG